MLFQAPGVIVQENQPCLDGISLSDEVIRFHGTCKLPKFMNDKLRI